MARESYYRRILEAQKQSFFLFGARGAGKSTWVRHELPTAHRIDLLDEAIYQSHLARPELFGGGGPSALRIAGTPRVCSTF